VKFSALVRFTFSLPAADFDIGALLLDNHSSVLCLRKGVSEK